MTKEAFFDMTYPEPMSGCWLWGGHTDKDGYGTIYHKTNDGFRRAHRYSYFLYKSEHPKEHCVLHTCDNPICVNPDHLFLGTNQQNTADRHSKNRNAKGAKHGMATLNDSQVLQILTLYATNKYGRCKLERMFNVSSHAIYCIVVGKTWKHIPFDREQINKGS